jgi:DMSO reductase anchor subunit
VILFTTLSGAGYGLLAVLGATLALGAVFPHPLAALALGLALASAGLVASTFHLGRPGRAWRAFSQWRTSWLSREGVLAVAVYLAALPLGATLLAQAPSRLLAILMALLATATVWCTAMIYASLKPVPQWRLPTVPPAYLLLGLASGALAVQAFASPSAIPVWLTALVVLALAAAWATKETYWRAAGRTQLPSLAEATGLTAFRDVHPLDPPHTESNYLLHEFGYCVARSHADRLRNLVRVLGFVLPLLASMALAVMPSVTLAILAALCGLVGILAERWLFFAEARHTAMLYYPAIR